MLLSVSHRSVVTVVSLVIQEGVIVALMEKSEELRPCWLLPTVESGKETLWLGPQPNSMSHRQYKSESLLIRI